MGRGFGNIRAGVNHLRTPIGNHNIQEKQDKIGAEQIKHNATSEMGVSYRIELYLHRQSSRVILRRGTSVSYGILLSGL